MSTAQVTSTSATKVGSRPGTPVESATKVDSKPGTPVESATKVGTIPGSPFTSATMVIPEEVSPPAQKELTTSSSRDDTRSDMLEPGASLTQKPRRSSIFEVSHPNSKHFGNSITSCSNEPAHRASSVTLPTTHVRTTLPLATIENTYCLGPPRKFISEPVEQIIQEVLDVRLQDKHYNSLSCASVAKQLSSEIKMKVTELNYDRYKIVAIVSIGEKKDHDVHFGSRCIWNTEWDTSASASFENFYIYAVGIVYAMYQD